MKHKQHTKNTVTIEMSATEFYNIKIALDIVAEEMMKQAQQAKTTEEFTFWARGLQDYKDMSNALADVRRTAKDMII